ncbi:Protein CBG27281 [Caenorhabditis briggsae]|uniref:Protein CBG27281 n=1 Tax=Caenorhabditis briggsae TaxID=6238 RepID=B6IJW9_CAEBR|nr:Protein CBG27281 [Caenorhabditis briggsae]CAS00199.1 Protein CBG27281 [Caenorhabditis briggsae]
MLSASLTFCSSKCSNF